MIRIHPTFFCHSHNFQFCLVSTIVNPTPPFWCKFLQVNSIVFKHVHLCWGFLRKVENWSTIHQNPRISKWNCDRDLSSYFTARGSFDETMCNCCCLWFYFYRGLSWVVTMVSGKCVLWRRLASSNLHGTMLPGMLSSKFCGSACACARCFLALLFLLEQSTVPFVQRQGLSFDLHA